MEKKSQTWTLVPKPRSAVKTMEWLPALLEVEGKDWDARNAAGERFVRREYLTHAHPFDVFSETDPEVNARMEMARYQTLGLAYLDTSDEITDAKVVVTPAGRLLAMSDNKEELLLRQLLKWQFPSNIHDGAQYIGMKVFPLQIILKLLEKYGSLNRFEVAFSVFTCKSDAEMPEVFERVDAFRRLTGGQPASNHKAIFQANFARFNGNTGNSPDTYLGNYDDTLFRYLEYTGIFETSGRGHFTRIFVPERARLKFGLLLQDYEFRFFGQFADAEKFYAYFGDPHAVALPWDKKGALREIVEAKQKLLTARGIPRKVEIGGLSHAQLQKVDSEFDSAILAANEEEFVTCKAETPEERQNILNKFQDILEGNEDLAALWMEVNTWKSLVAMKGSHFVKRNFSIEPDLTPRSFAAGVGNTPDMEFYNKQYIIIPEVSIQTGVQQWITEGSSVVEHVYKFLEVKNGKQFPGIDKIEQHMNPKNLKAIYGLFISQKLNSRLIWQFFVLSREAWLGEPICIVPMTLETYAEILAGMYERNVPALKFEQLIEAIAVAAKSSDNPVEWMDKQKQLVEGFLELDKAGV
jgi:hypothetical protein